MKKILFIIFYFISLNTFSQGGDNCGGATVLPVNATCVASTITNNENGRPEVGIPNPGCGSGTAPGSDIWYQITGTGGSVDINFSNSNRNASLAIWSDCPATTLISCLPIIAGTSGSIIFPTTAATTYYIQITRRSGGDNANMDGELCATTVSSAAPPNDNPCSATPLTVNAACTLLNTSNLNATNTAGVTAPGCASYSGGDVWYSFVMPASGNVSIESFANSLTDGGMAIYSGACGALTLISCDDDSGPGLMPAETVIGTAGTTYFIRFWEYGNNNNGTFGICVVAGTPPSGNQNCSTSTQICSDASFGGNSDGFSTQELNATNQGCLSSEHQSSWYYFSPLTTGTFSMAIRPAAGVDYDFAIWGPYNTLTCPVNTAPIRCSFASGFSTSIESIQGSPANYSTGLHATAFGNGNPVGTNDGGVGDALDGWVSPITVGAADVGKVYVLLIDNFTANSTAFTIDLTLSGGLTLNCVPLPIELYGFYGYYNNRGGNELSWITSSEIDNDYFILQNSIDGKEFNTIGLIDGAGNSTKEIKYEFTDVNFKRNRINYYKLTQVDFDGDMSNSTIIAIDNKCIDCHIVKRYNILGQEVDESFKGIIFEEYSNGDIIKILK